MPCSIELINRLSSSPTLGGYFVYLGYSSTSLVDNSTNTGSDNGSNCFGITDPLTNGAGPYDDVADPTIGLTANTLIDSVPSPNISFDGVTPGFYGFMYIIGDTNGDGEINGLECGDVECFEIEVLKGPADMVTEDFDPICEASLPSTVDVLSKVTDYVPGGTWSVAGNGSTSIDLSDPSSVTIPSGIPAPTTVVFTYNISANDLTSTHPMDTGCSDCSATITIELPITEVQSAGIGNSITVCN